MLWRKPAHADAAAPVAGGQPVAANIEGQAAEVAAQVNRAVHQSLDEIKDTLFRLELRRQAGTISEQEYAEQRACTEQTLRELVKG
jgi:hypothetical protein